MWWARSEATGAAKARGIAHAWVGERCFAWKGKAGVSAQAVERSQDAVALLTTKVGNDRPRTLTMWLSSSVCRLERVPAVEGVRHRAEAEAAVAALLRARSSLRDTAKVWLPHWPYPGAYWCVAVADGALLQACDQAAGKALRSIKPWWSWVLADLQAQHLSADRKDVAWALYDGDALITASVDAQGGVVEACTVWPVPDPSAAQRVLNRRVASGAARVAQCVSLEIPVGLAGGEVSADATGFGFSEFLQRDDAF